uniref:Uncharacterized protein n=1 Tax=Anguilla anguilla TaxID=7936 RepID=A0A0E9X9V2_ANGAN
MHCHFRGMGGSQSARITACYYAPAPPLVSRAPASRSVGLRSNGLPLTDVCASSTGERRCSGGECILS